MSTVADKTTRIANRRRGRLAVAIAIAATAAATALAPAAAASQHITAASWGFTGLDGGFADQAGSHPDFRIDYQIASRVGSRAQQTLVPYETVKSNVVDMPPGFVGDPTAAPFCSEAELAPGPEPDTVDCALDSQIGTVRVNFTDTLGVGDSFPLYNIVPPPGQPAQFAANVLGVIIKINPRVRGTDYGISAEVANIAEANLYPGFGVTLWGVPSDPSHDAQRVLGSTGSGNTPSTYPRHPFLTLPTSCPGTPFTTTLGINSWPEPDVFDTKVLQSDTPTVIQGCDQLPFEPSITVKPESRVADGPTGLAVDLKVPQNEDPDGLATAHVRRAVVTLPEGMSVSPSSASGLGACSPAQIGLGSDDPVACPDSSKVGSVEIDTPPLQDPLKGDVYLATQNANPFGSLLAMYIVAEGSGVLVKLPGRIDADPVTGRLTTTFDNTPQLPFSEMRLTFRSGPRAPLATPTTCGTYNTHASFTSWASDHTVELDTPMTIDQNCGPHVFAPGVSAGMKDPIGGAFSPFVLHVDRGDGQSILSELSLDLPAGVLAKLKGVPLCGDAEAAVGACDAGSRVGSATVGAGPGASPFYLKDQPVYLTGPYKGAPYGLAVVTRVIAGPIDLGYVVVRSAIYVDRNDAHVTVKSDPLPTILQGIPLRIRTIDIAVDRPGFMLNPTNCTASQIKTAIKPIAGDVATVSSPFQVGACAALPFDPQLNLSLTDKTQVTDGKHPGIKAVLTQGAGEAGMHRATVTLPLSLALDPDNAESLCEYADGLKVECPESSVIGTVKEYTPVLDQPLVGKVYFVKGVRFNSKGRPIKTLPTLLMPLHGQGTDAGIEVDLRATSDAQGGKLVTTFDNIPDVPNGRFELNLNGGKHGIIVVTTDENVCKGSQEAEIASAGQNGKQTENPVFIETPCAKRPTVGKAALKGGKVHLRVIAPAAGKLRAFEMQGRLKAVTRSVTKKGRVSFTLTPTRRAVVQARRTGKLALDVVVSYTDAKKQQRTMPKQRIWLR
jgi:hypothetical protein